MLKGWSLAGGTFFFFGCGGNFGDGDLGLKKELTGACL